MSKVCFLGAGSWGTALAVLVAGNGHDVTLWSAVSAEMDMLEEHREHMQRLPGTKIPDAIILERDLETACRNQDLIVLSVASPYVRIVAAKIKDFLPQGQVIVNVGKGIEENTLYTLSEVVEDELKGMKVCVLSGPSHAEEVVKGVPTTVVVGAQDYDTACFIQNIFMNGTFRVYTSPDIIGIELGGSLKNVIALAAGIVDGIGFGDNTRAALMTRGIAEMSRLGIAMGGKLETFSGLSGVGDLIVTCTSLHSRNHTAGYLIGQGASMEDAMKEVNQVVEGVYSAKAAYKLSQKYHVSMPIVEQMNAVLFDGKTPQQAMKDLLERDRADEYKTMNWN